MDTNQNTHALPNQEKWIDLSRKEIKRIFIYYIIMFCLSLIIMVLFIVYFTTIKSQDISLVLVVLFSFDCGILGGSFYYIRKLYKTCIQSLIEPNTKTVSIESLGTKVYFYFRPIMGATLAILTVLGVYGGFFVLLERPIINSDKFYIFVALAAFLIGYSNGKIIVKLDNSTSKVADMIQLNGGQNDEPEE